MKILAAFCISVALFGMKPAQAMTPEQVQTAEGLLKAKEYEKLREITLPLAQKGDPEAMTFVGLSYRRVGKSKVGCDWYEKAANANFPRAVANLGVCYSLGQGRKKDKYRAEKLYLQAAEFGQMNAAIGLGLIYQQGHTGEKDIDKAIYWFKYASDRGDGAASLLLSRLYKLNLNDHKLHLKYARLAGERGYKKGWMHLLLVGSEQDKKDAKQHLSMKDIACVLTGSVKETSSILDECK